MRILFVMPVLLLLPACAPVAVFLSYSQPVVQIATQLDQTKLIADGIVYASSGKTIVDHVASAATGSDCKITNALSGASICASICR